MNKKVIIYTDGACSGNPGPGGWGAVLQYNGVEKEICGGAYDTTNNRMELMAVIVALETIKEPCDITITTDSKYVCDAINLGWLKSWKSNGWKRAKNKPVLNLDLWQRLDKQLSIHNTVFKWVKGHSGHRENEMCDKMAVEQSKLHS